jgi:hypothetical protein
MPKLAILAACEKVIIDRVGLPSIINVFQRMNVKLVDPIPENAIVPNAWAIFVLWQHTADEQDVEFTQRLEVIAPDGKPFLTGETKFKITEVDDLQSKNHIVINGLPVWAEGFVTINVWLEGSSEQDKHSYAFAIKYLPNDASDPSQVAKLVN